MAAIQLGGLSALFVKPHLLYLTSFPSSPHKIYPKHPAPLYRLTRKAKLPTLQLTRNGFLSPHPVSNPDEWKYAAHLTFSLREMAYEMAQWF